MSLSVVHSRATRGIEAVAVNVEMHVAPGLPGLPDLHVVGLLGLLGLPDLHVVGLPELSGALPCP